MCFVILITNWKTLCFSLALTRSPSDTYARVEKLKSLLSGRKACQDLVLTHTYISARGVRDHLRKYSEHDAVRILDWHSKLFIRGAPLDLDCTNIFELESTESMMASGTFHVNVTVIRKPLWDDEPQGPRG